MPEGMATDEEQRSQAGRNDAETSVYPSDDLGDVATLDRRPVRGSDVGMPGPLPLCRDFYERATERVARELIGAEIARRDGAVVRRGRIVETEAYLGQKDLACHSAKGRTGRTEVMFGPPGHAYVYFVYGVHHCVNVVTRPVGEAEAVLIRAIEPVAHCLGAGDGPGKVCRALAIDKRFNGADLTGEELFILPPEKPARSLAVGPRVGVAYAGRWARRLLRFWEEGSPSVSRAGGTRARHTAL